jgi:hypothetical protein
MRGVLRGIGWGALAVAVLAVMAGVLYLAGYQG